MPIGLQRAHKAAYVDWGGTKMRSFFWATCIVIALGVGVIWWAMAEANTYWTAYHAETQRMRNIGCKVVNFVGQYTIYKCPDGNLYKRL